MKIFHSFLERRALLQMNIAPRKPRKSGVTATKRPQEIIISLTSFPARIHSAHKTIYTLLNQDTKPDRVILWLANEQFPNKTGIPKKILALQPFGLEIRWYHDIRSYKKLIPAIKEFPNAIIVTVDDDWYYRRDMLQILLDEHRQFPNEVICHDVTHPRFNEHNQLVSGSPAHPGTSSFFNKILSGSGVLFPPGCFAPEISDEGLFTALAPTNDDIWFWAMAVKNGTKIRLATHAQGTSLMTDVEMQQQTSLDRINGQGNTYQIVTNQMLTQFPAVYANLMAEHTASQISS